MILETTSTLALLPGWLNPQTLLTDLGPWALIGATAIIFAECGLLIGFFLPGDSLLFLVGAFIATGAIQTPLWLALIILAAAAVIGNACGYWIGRLIGPRLFDKPNSKIFKQEYVDKTSNFFEKYGARAIILARFVPIVRTFITATAGIGKMNFRTFMTYSAIGGIAWACGVTWLGHELGKIQFVSDHVEIILVLVVLISIIPMVFEYIRHKRGTEEVVEGVVEDLHDEIEGHKKKPATD